jgi:hypothetical protein
MFRAAISPEELLKGLGSGNIFSRGLPPRTEMSHALARVLRVALNKGFVSPCDLQTPDDKEALICCFEKGWLHAEKPDSGSPGKEDVYIFASPVHRWYSQALLAQSDTVVIREDRLLQFVTNVIKLFSPINLSTPRHISPQCIQRPPEAHFQDEFYRCSYEHTGGSVLFPEFGTPCGRVDFFIPSKKWAIELVRNGMELAQHSARFSGKGTYRHHVDADDYIILDFRDKETRSSHSSAFIFQNAQHLSSSPLPSAPKLISYHFHKFF